MKQDNFVQTKTDQEKALDLFPPRLRRLITERPVEVERLAARWCARSGQEPSIGEALQSLSRKPAVRPGNYDEAHSAESPQLRPKLGRDWSRRMKDELTVAESEDGHSNGDPDQASLPTKLVLSAPEVAVMLH